MKRCFILASLVMLMLYGNAQSKDERSLLNAVESLRKAMIDADTVLLGRLADAQLSYGHSGGTVEGKRDFIEKIASGKSDFVTILLSEQTVSISADLGIVRHKLFATTNDNGKPGEVHLKVLLVWQKRHGEWKLLARQAVKDQ